MGSIERVLRLRTAVALVVSFVLSSAVLFSQVRECKQTADDVTSCDSCTAAGEAPPGVTFDVSCDEDCREGQEDCEDCCFTCEAIATGLTGVDPWIHVEEVGSSPVNEDSDFLAPFAVTIDVTVTCNEGAEGAYKCVEFILNKQRLLQSTEWKKCVRVDCAPCPASE